MTQNSSRASSSGLSPAIKTLLIVVGIILAIGVYTTWAFIINSTSSFAEPSETATSESEQEAAADEGGAENEAALTQARDQVASMTKSPTCDDSSAAFSALSEFVSRADEAGGVTEDDHQLVLDALSRIDSQCPTTYALELSDELVSPDSPPDLSSIAVSTDWVSDARPAPDGASEKTNFSTEDQNIHCLIQVDRVACSIYAYSFPSIPDSCETYTQTAFVAARGDSQAECSWRVISDDKVEDGDFAANGYACHVSKEAVECWAEKTGRGFELSEDELRQF